MFCDCNVLMNLNIIRVPVKSRAWSFPLYRMNPLNAELNRICHLLALLGAHQILQVSRIRFNMRNVECASGGWVCHITQIYDYIFKIINKLNNN